MCKTVPTHSSPKNLSYASAAARKVPQRLHRGLQITASQQVDSSRALLIGNSCMDMQRMGTDRPCGYVLLTMELRS